MSPRTWLYSIWCSLFVLAAVVATYYAWSPFSDGERDRTQSAYGPRHK